MESNGRRGLPAKILCNKLDEAKIENSKRLVRKYEQVIELIFYYNGMREGFALSNLNERCEQILQILTRAGDYITLKEIANRTGVSRRSIYYDICNINDWLDDHGLKELEAERGRGILLSAAEKEAISAAMGEKEFEEYYQFLPSDRQKIIITYIIQSEEPVYIEQLIDICHVSRNTVFGDIKIVVQLLNEYSLELRYEPKKGYVIFGSPVQIRALFILYYESLRSLAGSGLIPFLARENVQEYYDRLENVRKELGVDYVEGSIDALALLLPIMYRYQDPIYFPELKMGEIENSVEYGLVRKYFPDLKPDEQVYLSLHLLGARLSVSTEEIFEKRSDQSIYGITKALVTEFEKTACVTFSNREELERALFIHIRSSMYRYQYGIQIGNPMTEDVVREYPNLFELTKHVTVYLEQMINLPIPDSEVAYLALHFGAFLKSGTEKHTRLRILIVCSNGVSTGNMLRHEVESLLPEAEIVDVLPASKLVNVQDMCDLVISTVRISAVVPVLVVHPILTNEDRLYILSNSLVADFTSKGTAQRLFDVVKKYVDPSDYEALKKDINQFMLFSNVPTESIVSERDRGIVEILDASKIRIYEDGMKWTDAIYRAGEPLLQNGSIIEHYLDSIISQTMYYGPYMFITDDICLAHAKPEDGVNRIDVALSLFRQGIPFPGGKTARAIIVLSAENNEKHLRVLNDLLTFAEDRENLQALIDAAGVQEVMDLLREKLR